MLRRNGSSHKVRVVSPEVKSNQIKSNQIVYFVWQQLCWIDKNKIQ